VVLGPEKLPRVVSEVGRWVGRARAMARQFREQLEEEVQLEEARKAKAAQRDAPPPPNPQEPPAPPAQPPPPAADPYAHHADAAGPEPSVRARARLNPDEPGT
jgi:sec-independent protein translocase protein TatB